MRKLDEEKLFEDIRTKGVKISSINDLRFMNKDFKGLIPILLDHMKQTDDENEKEILVRALGVKGFTEAVPDLIDEFYKGQGSSYKWAIGDSLYTIRDKKSLDDLVRIVQEKEHGHSRQMIVLALGKMKYEKAIPVLIDLLQDKDVAGHAVAALGNFSDVSIIPHLEPFTSHKMTWIRNEAKRGIERIKKKASNIND